MKRLSVISLVLLVAGCQSGVGSPPPDDEPQDEVLEQPFPDEPEAEPEPEPQPEPEPEPITRIRAGSYVGTLQCDLETAVVGSLPTRIDRPQLETATFDSDGNLLVTGAPIRIGDISTRGPSADPWFFVYRSITNSSNALILAGEAHKTFACGNTCFFAFDFICDEIGSCNVGTDCADCGALILRGSFTTTYQSQENGTIRMMRNVSVLEEDASLVRMSFNCDGILSR